MEHTRIRAAYHDTYGNGHPAHCHPHPLVHPHGDRYATHLTPTFTPTRTNTPRPPTFTLTATPTRSCVLGWDVVNSPNASTNGDNVLQGVSAFVNDDTWAVGYALNGNVYQTLIQFWTVRRGRSSVVPTWVRATTTCRQ